MTPARSTLLVTSLLYALFFFWYGGSSVPLTPEEADTIIDEIEKNAKARSGTQFDPALIDSFRVLTRNDDGREFYMLNLMRLRQKAVYPDGYDYDDDPQAAADRYAAAVIPELLIRGSLPILIGNYSSAFIPAHPASDWDQIGIVRYRSRRDMLEMAREMSLRGGGEHKWASLEETIVFPIKPVFDLVFVRGVVFIVFFSIGGAVAFGLRRPGALLG